MAIVLSPRFLSNPLQRGNPHSPMMRQFFIVGGNILQGLVTTLSIFAIDGTEA